MRLSALGLLLWCLASGCGGDDAKSPVYSRPGLSDARVGDSCIDEDGDGYGVGCVLGRDCDDEVWEITDVCYRCSDDEPAEGCPCEPGTEAVWCPSSEVADQTGAEEGGKHGVLKCTEGARYCRDALWSECTGVSWVFEAY